MRLIKTTIKKSTLITLLVMFGCSFVVAQTNENIKGRVLSQSDEPIPGVTIINENEPSAQTQTDEKGEFAIYSNKGDVIGFRAVGYMENSLVYEGQSFLNVRLEISESSLDEVVVVGYGTQRRKDLVGSVEQIGGEHIRSSTEQLITLWNCDYPCWKLYNDSDIHILSIRLRSWCKCELQPVITFWVHKSPIQGFSRINHKCDF